MDTIEILLTHPGNDAEAQRLIENGANLRATNADGKLPIHLAAENGIEQVVQLLIQRQSDLSAKDRHGYTPLHWAAFWGNRTELKLIRNQIEMKKIPF